MKGGVCLHLNIWMPEPLRGTKQSLHTTLKRVLSDIRVGRDFTLGVALPEPSDSSTPDESIVQFGKNVTSENPFGFLFFVVDEKGKFDEVYKDFLFFGECFPSDAIQIPFELSCLEDKVRQLHEEAKSRDSFTLRQAFEWYRKFARNLSGQTQKEQQDAE